MTYCPRAIVIFAVWVALLAGPAGAAALQATPPSLSPAAVLDGRLGGSRDSFAAAYGEPRPSGIDAAFDIADYGLVQVQFGGTDETGPAMVITLRAERPSEAAATAPDDGDWTLAQARRRVARFLPSDAELGGPRPSGPQAATLACRSAALADAFGDLGGAAGDCRVAYVMPTPETVSFATLVLTGDDDTSSDAPDNPCAGMVAWSQATGERLADASALLEQIAALDAATSDAATPLEAAATRFDELTAAQRDQAAPASAATVNYYLIAGFKAYGDALHAAAAAVAAGDTAAANAAAADLGAAGDTTTRGIDELRVAIADCNLAPATPAA